MKTFSFNPVRTLINRFWQIALILAISTSLIGCGSSSKIQNKTVSKPNKQKSSVRIQTFYEKPETMQDKNTIHIAGSSKGEYVQITVQGEIKDFELVRLKWDDATGGLQENGNLKQIKSLKDNTVVIDTQIPDGIPVEKIKWKSIDGKEFEYILQQSGMDDENNGIKEFDMDIESGNYGLNQLLEHLKAKNYSAEVKDSDHSFLPSTHKRIPVGKEGIDVYLYDNHEEMEKDARSIDTGGCSYDNGNLSVNISWVSYPHFYKKGNIIVLYVGENEKIKSDLKEILGPTFAG